MAYQNPKTVSSPCCDSAEKILDDSQGHRSQSSPNPGHPRYHVVCHSNFDKFTIINDLPALGCTEAVTKHLGNTKTAFLSKADQNSALHDVLSIDAGKEAIRLLNAENDEVLLRVATSLLPSNRNLRMVEVVHGEKMEERAAASVVLILGHHLNKPLETYVHVKTFYPTNRDISGYALERLH